MKTLRNTYRYGLTACMMAMLFLAIGACGYEISGELKKWHCVTINFEGPETTETADLNPFLDYKLTVVFKHDNKLYSVPGFYAADGQSEYTGASGGNKWRVRFTPDETGYWRFYAIFRKGDNVAVQENPFAGKPAAFDGERGGFSVEPLSGSQHRPPPTRPYRATRNQGEQPQNLGAYVTPPELRDLTLKGRLEYTGERYLRFAETGKCFLKAGADSPENFLAYFEFDQTPTREELEDREGEAKQNPIHHYEPHRKDWREGDPIWREGRGKNIIGAINYLASMGMNSIYFLTMNVEGDGDDVWPWISRTDRLRFDCSKLAQWELVFSHMENQGIVMHVITQETENDQLLNGGKLGLERKLYYRELVARFGHHLGLVWNLGEENTNTDTQRKQFAHYLKSLDAYDHPIVVHTYPGKYGEVYEPLLGMPYFNGPSLQMGDMKKTHSETLRWIKASEKAGHSWFVCLDEIGPANTGVKPDADDPDHADVVRHALWGNLMAGGAGAEWYFGYQYPHNDLNCEDWRSRENMWKLTRNAINFFQYVGVFRKMTNYDELTGREDAYCFADIGLAYIVYLPDGGTTTLKLPEREFGVQWYDPFSGKIYPEISTVKGNGGYIGIGKPPDVDNKKHDWVAFIR